MNKKIFMNAFALFLGPSCFLLSFGIALLLPANAVAQRRKMRLSSRLVEISGLTFDRQGRLWAVNDSGNPAELFELHPKNGDIIRSIPMPFPNQDWEELTTDPAGNIWIADFGNNQSKRNNLRIFRYHPDTGVYDSLLFNYPDQTAFPPKTDAERVFDCEAMVWANDTLHIFTKSRFAGKHFTKHYTLPATPGKYTATLRDSLQLPKRAVTAAALSKDGKTFMLVAYYVKKRRFFLPCTRATLYEFIDFQPGYYLQGKREARRLPKILIARQYESVAVVPGRRKWMVANEGILWQKPAIRTRSF